MKTEIFDLMKNRIEINFNENFCLVDAPGVQYKTDLARVK